MRRCLGKIEEELKRVHRMMRESHSTQDENSVAKGAMGLMANKNKLGSGDALAGKWQGQLNKAIAGGVDNDNATRRLCNMMPTSHSSHIHLTGSMASCRHCSLRLRRCTKADQILVMSSTCYCSCSHGMTGSLGCLLRHSLRS